MSYTPTRVFVIACLLALCPALRADDVDDFLKAEMQLQRIPGLSVAVVKDGKVVKAAGYGTANVELNSSAAADTVYKIGSVSKQFIATGVVLLAEDGKLSLEDKVGKFIGTAPPAWSDITVRHLLSHTSGLVRESPAYDDSKKQSDADLVRAAFDKPLRFSPGERYEYCNFGYFVAAEVIRQASGMGWDEFLKQRLFSPLNMTDTRATTARDVVPRRSAGYVLVEGKLSNAANPVAVRPSGAFLSSAQDLAAWAVDLHSNRHLPTTARKLLWTPTTLTSGKSSQYGLGWELGDFRGIPVTGHGGVLDGFRSQFTVFPEHGVTVIVLANLETANASVIANGVATKYVSDVDLLTMKAPAETPAVTVLTKGIRTFLTDVAQGAKEPSGASPELVAVCQRLPQASRDSLANLLQPKFELSFLSQRDVSGKGFHRLGASVESVVCVRFASAERTRYCTLYLNKDKQFVLFEVTAL